MTTLFPADPYDGVAVFDAPLVYLAAVEATNYPLAEVLPLPTGRDVTGVACPTGAVAATSYFGPYDGLGDAWGRFMGDVAASGHRPSPTFLEIYVSNPLETPDPSALRTDLVVFLS